MLVWRVRRDTEDFEEVARMDVGAAATTLYVWAFPGTQVDIIDVFTAEKSEALKPQESTASSASGKPFGRCAKTFE